MNAVSVGLRLAQTLKAAAGEIGGESSVFQYAIPKQIERGPKGVVMAYRLLAGSDITIDEISQLDFWVCVAGKERLDAPIADQPKTSIMEAAMLTARKLEAAGFNVVWREESYLEKAGLHAYTFVATGQ